MSNLLVLSELEVKYLHHYNRTQEAIQKLQERIHDMPAPENEESPATWGDVGDMNRRADALEEILQIWEGK